MTERTELAGHVGGWLLMIVAIVFFGFGSGIFLREHLGWNRETAQSLYWCGIVRGTRSAKGLPETMPNNEAECSALERSLVTR